jgi:protein Hikeshi
LCNEKPSSIFKITSLKHDTTSADLLPFGSLAPHHVSTAMVGISVEPVSQIDALVPATEAQPSNNVNSFVEFSQKMLENFYNYAASFSKSAPDGISYVPLNTLQNWFESFKRRLIINPNFWKS